MLIEVRVVIGGKLFDRSGYKDGLLGKAHPYTVLGDEREGRLASESFHHSSLASYVQCHLRPNSVKRFNDRLLSDSASQEACGSRWIRVRPRKPSRGKVITRGRNAGLPTRRQTDSRAYMTWQDMLALIDAQQFAESINQPLNTFLTLTWRSVPGFDRSTKAWNACHRNTERALKQWLRGQPLTMAWFRENCVGMGSHTHFLVHIPKCNRIQNRRDLTRFLAQKLGATAPSFAHAKFSRTSQSRRGLLQYAAKCLNPEEDVFDGTMVLRLATFAGINTRPHARIPCKRVGWTQNIGEKTRKSTGWIDRKSPADLQWLIGKATP